MHVCMYVCKWNGLEWKGKEKEGKGNQCSRRLLGLIGRDPSAFNINQLHVDIFRFYFYSREVYFVNSSKLIGFFFFFP